MATSTKTPRGGLRILPTSLALSLALANVAHAQRNATVTGVLVDRGTRVPVEGARVNILGTTLGASSDSGGRFDVAGVPPGVRVIQVRAIGYTVASYMVELDEGQILRQIFELEGRALTVDSIAATGIAPEHWRSEAGFDRRRRNGVGFFFTREEIQQRRAATVSDLLRAVPGVSTACRTRGCQVLMSQSGRPCAPEYFLDGYPATSATGPTFSVQQVRGVEVYRSRFDVPAEFQRPNLSCGVIAIWTIEPGTRLENH